MKRLCRLVGLICLIASSGVFAYSDLDVSAGTMTLGGALSFPMRFNKAQPGSFVDVNVSPEFGYFVIDGLELAIGATYARNLWSGSPNFQAQNNWGVKAGLDYYFDLGSPAFPFLGAQGWFEWHGDGTDIQIYIPLGVLVSLNEYVGVSFAIPVKVGFAAGKSEASRNGYAFVSLDPGYLGLKAFF